MNSYFFSEYSVLLLKNIWKYKRLLVSRGENAVKSQKDIFQKLQKLLTERAPQRQPIKNISIAIHSFSMAGYVTNVLVLSVANSHPEKHAVSVIFEN